MVRKLLALAFVATLTLSTTAWGVEAVLDLDDPSTNWTGPALSDGAVLTDDGGMIDALTTVDGTFAVGAITTDPANVSDGGNLKIGTDGSSKNFSVTIDSIVLDGNASDIIVGVAATAVEVLGAVTTEKGLLVESGGTFKAGATTVVEDVTVNDGSIVTLDSLTFADLTGAHNITLADANSALTIKADVVMGTGSGAGTLNIDDGGVVTFEQNLTIGGQATAGIITNDEALHTKVRI